MTKPTLTYERVKQLLTWDPTNAVFRWNATKGAGRAGSVAGTYSGKYRRLGIDGYQYPISLIQSVYGIEAGAAGPSREPYHIDRADNAATIQMKKNIHRCQTALGTAEKKYTTLQTRWRQAEAELTALRAALAGALHTLEHARRTRNRIFDDVERRAAENGVPYKIAR